MAVTQHLTFSQASKTSQAMCAEKIDGFSSVWKHVAQTGKEEIKLGFTSPFLSLFPSLLFASIIWIAQSSANIQGAKIWAGFSP